MTRAVALAYSDRLRDRAVAHAWAGWLQESWTWQVYTTFTYRDGYWRQKLRRRELTPIDEDEGMAAWVRQKLTWVSQKGPELGRIGPSAVLGDLERFFRDIGYKGQHFHMVEDHAARLVPHMHGVMQDVPRMLVKQAWEDSGRGFARVLPVEDGGVSYVTKYLWKDGSCDRILERL